MRKVFFIMMFAIAGSFGIASAQVEQAPPQNSGTTNSNQSTSPNTQTKKQGTYQNQGTSTTTPQGTYEKQGTSTTTPQGTYQNQGTSTTTPKGIYEKQGTSTTTTPQGTYGNQSTTTPNTQNMDTMNHSQGTMNKSQGTMNKAQGSMNKSQGTMNKSKGTMNQTQGSMSQDEKGWTKIGEKTVNMSKDREEIAVTGAEKFSSIKIKVPEDAMVDLKDVVVEYEGGTKQNVDMSSMISSSSMGTSEKSTSDESKVIELNSSDRNVKKISFTYEPRDSKSSMSTSSSKGKMHSSKGKMHSSMDKDREGTSENTKGMMGTKSSKAKIEVWGLKADTALR